MRDDLGVAIRRVARNKGSTLFILLLLSLAIAINACVFSVAYGLLWKPLPYPREEQLVQLVARSAKMGIDLGWPAPYLDVISKNSQRLEAVAGYQRKEVAIANADGRYTGTAELVLAEPRLFSLLSARPEIGRLPNADDARPGADLVALIGSELWQARFGKSDSVLEQRLYLGGKSYRIVGVLPRSFVFPTKSVQIWLPLGFSDAELAVENAGSFGSMRAIGRLRSEGGVGDTSGEMMRLVRSNHALQGIADEIDLKVSAEPLRKLWIEDRGNSLKLMLAAAFLVFCVTAVNAYNLFMLRLLRRRQEFAVLEAVGSTRWRRTLQIGVEAGLLSTAAAAIAICAMPFGFKLLRHLAVLPEGMPQSIGFDWATAGFILAMCAIAAALLASASLMFHKQNVYEVLRQTGNGQTASARVQRFRKLLVVGQIATTFVLLFGTSLLVRSSNRLLDEDIGFDRSNRLVGTVRPMSSGAEDDSSAIRSKIAAWKAAAEASPEVGVLALSTSTPYSKNVTLEGFRVSNRAESTREGLPKAYIFYVSANYPAAVGLSILRGRSFTVAEAEQRSPVALIDAGIAERYFPGENPEGKAIAVTDSATGQLVEVAVVGVVGNTRQRTLMARDEYPSIYLPDAVPYARPGIPINSVDFVVKAERPSVIGGILEQRLQTAAPALRLTRVATMEARISETIIDALRLNSLLKILSAIAVLLTAAGLYALLSHIVVMRNREFGIRQALGADSTDLLADVLLQGVRMIALAFAIALPLAVLLGSTITPRLYGISAFDPVSVLIVSGLLLIVGLIANAMPAYRASRVNPMEALRTD